LVDPHRWGYFAHVSKAKTLEAMQVFAPEQVNRLAKLKKAELANEAERLVAETMWLPVMFRAWKNPVTEVSAVEVGRGFGQIGAARAAGMPRAF
jgi:ParB family chromosome partitioning protein